MDIDNKESPLSVDGTSNEHLADAITHQLEVNAYRSVLQVFCAKETLSWETEQLLSKLRLHLHITDEEYLFELEKLNIH